MLGLLNYCRDQWTNNDNIFAYMRNNYQNMYHNISYIQISAKKQFNVANILLVW